MEKGYVIVKFVSGSDKLLSEITMSGNQNLHNTRWEIYNAGWVDHEDTLYVLPSGYVYKCQNDNFVLTNPEFETEIPEFYLS